MTDPSSAPIEIPPQKRLRQLRIVKTMEDLTAVCRQTRSLIKRREIALPDAMDSLCAIADPGGRGGGGGGGLFYEVMRRRLPGGAAEDLDERPDYGARVVNVKAPQTMRFPPMRYVLPGLIPEGLTILAARPKAKKSW